MSLTLAQSELPSDDNCKLGSTSIDDWDGTDNAAYKSGIDINVAIKGIIAIGAMSKMSSAAGHVADANKYSVRTDSSGI
jgi:hypothetical protein